MTVQVGDKGLKVQYRRRCNQENARSPRSRCRLHETGSGPAMSLDTIIGLEHYAIPGFELPAVRSHRHADAVLTFRCPV